MPEQREWHARRTETGKKALPAVYPDGDNGHLYIPAAQEAALFKDANPPPTAHLHAVVPVGCVYSRRKGPQGCETGVWETLPLELK